MHRCEITGEILSGCNRYTHIRYSEECLDEIGAPYLSPVTAAIEKLGPNRDFGSEIGWDCHVFRDGLGYYIVRISDQKRTAWHNTPRYAARALGLLLREPEGSPEVTKP